MKKIILLLGIITLLANVSFAQENKTVTLTVSGQGQTQDEAKQNALRNAIEQAFGTFISSNTEILNDDLVKDEIVSVSNGNIQKFEILSEVQMQNGEWSNTLKAVVSVTKLTSFCESKGIGVEFKGSLFAFNINQQILNEKNEVKAIEDVCQVIRNIADVSFDFEITASDPISVDTSNSKWRIPMYISVYKNSNFDNIPKVLYSTLKGLSLSLDEAKNYIQLGKNVYPISIASNENDYSYIILRTEKSISQLLETLYYFNHSLQNFKILNGIAEWILKDHPKNIKGIDDEGFRIFLRGGNDGYNYNAYRAASLFHKRKFSNRRETGLILSYKDWKPINVMDFQTGFVEMRLNNGRMSSSGYFSNQFYFVNKLDLLEGELIHRGPLGEYKTKGLITGIVISFLPNEINNSKKKKNKNKNKINSNSHVELVKFYYDDIRDINEINKISVYKVLPINN